MPGGTKNLGEGITVIKFSGKIGEGKAAGQIVGGAGKGKGEIGRGLSSSEVKSFFPKSQGKKSIASPETGEGEGCTCGDCN